MSIERELIDCAGGPSEVARKFETTPQAVSKWGRTRIPADRLMDLIDLCPQEMRVRFKPQILRPDVFKESAA